jgi:hypothetical protein
LKVNLVKKKVVIEAVGKYIKNVFGIAQKLKEYTGLFCQALKQTFLEASLLPIVDTKKLSPTL